MVYMGMQRFRYCSQINSQNFILMFGNKSSPCSILTEITETSEPWKQFIKFSSLHRSFGRTCWSLRKNVFWYYDFQIYLLIYASHTVHDTFGEQFINSSPPSAAYMQPFWQGGDELILTEITGRSLTSICYYVEEIFIIVCIGSCNFKHDNISISSITEW